jgi:N-acetyl-gamma-glutamyl-phosphate reductase common form
MSSQETPPIQKIPTIVLGGSGYVAGELLRLLAGHPNLHPAAVVSTRQAGQPIATAFPHLASCYPDLSFVAPEALPGFLKEHPKVAAFCAAPHGASAQGVDDLLTAAQRAGTDLRVVDLSADFRFSTSAAYEEVYGHPHGAPHRLEEFRCNLPEHVAETPRLHVAHPGCFTTAATLATVPFLRLGLVEPEISVVAITGSTGAGRTPTGATHHPARRSNLYAYNPLRHRHQPEMRNFASAALAASAASGNGDGEATIHFVPHAGPFARGIHATVLMTLRAPWSAEEVTDALAHFYWEAPFVDVLPEPPRLQDVVGTNRCLLGVAVDGEQLVVCSAIDNLVKGAAGGAIQWMNRLLGLPETTGLTLPGLGWL